MSRRNCERRQRSNPVPGTGLISVDCIPVLRCRYATRRDDCETLLAPVYYSNINLAKQNQLKTNQAQGFTSQSRRNDIYLTETNLSCENLKLFSWVTFYAGVKQYAIHLRTRQVAVLRLHCVKITMELGLETSTMRSINTILFLYITIDKNSTINHYEDNVATISQFALTAITTYAQNIIILLYYNSKYNF